MIKLFAWLAGSQIGRWVASGLLVTLTLSLFALRLYSKGQTAERARQTQQALKRLRERMKVDATISRLPSDERRQRLSDDWAN